MLLLSRHLQWIAGFVLVACACTSPVATWSFEEHLARGAWANVGRNCDREPPATVAPFAASFAFATEPLPQFADLNVLSAWLARRLPAGWGGGIFYRRRSADPAMYLKRPAERDSLMPALARLPEGQQYVGLAMAAEVLQARWDFAELYDWSLYLRDRLPWSAFSIISWDINEAGNRLDLGLDERRPQAVAQLEARLRELNVPCFLVRYRLEPMAVVG